MGCLTNTCCPARGALLIRNFPGLIPLWHLDFCGIYVKYPRNRHFSSFRAGDDVPRLRDAAPARSSISPFLEILINFIIDLSFLEI